MVDYKLFLDCVHCGLCTSACPTYLESGDENESPRGRIYLMRAVTDSRLSLDTQVRKHLDLCLDCRACETACPSGVKYGQLIESFRMDLQKHTQAKNKSSWLMRLLLFGIATNSRRLRLALAPARLMQWLRLDRFADWCGFLQLLPAPFRQLQCLLPNLEPHHGLPELLAPHGPLRARVALFTGCAADAIFPQTNLATALVLQRNGCQVWIPRAQVCCGALHYHAGEAQAAQNLALGNVVAFAERLQDLDAIIVNAAGCGVMLKDYGALLGDNKGQEFAAKIRDVSEFLMELGPILPEHPLPVKAVYHDACHLCHGQQIRSQPRQLLEMIPGLKLLALPESEVCCGAAGSYNLTQPQMAEQLGRRKARQIVDSGAEAVFAGNVGCILQIARYLKQATPSPWVAHPMDALWLSYDGGDSAGIQGKLAKTTFK